MDFFQWFDENIFDHVGRKIQNYAIITLVLDVIICGVLAFMVLPGRDGYLHALIILLCGLGYALLLAFPIYAFGQLVEDIHQTKENTQRKERITEELPDL